MMNHHTGEWILISVEEKIYSSCLASFTGLYSPLVEFWPASHSSWLAVEGVNWFWYTIISTYYFRAIYNRGPTA